MNGVQCVPHGSVDGRGQWQNRAGERLQLSEAECLLSMFPAIKRNGKHVMNACVRVQARKSCTGTWIEFIIFEK